MTADRRVDRVVRRRRVTVFGALLAALLGSAVVADVPWANGPRTIAVGVRSDAEPFSYLASQNAREPILPNYGGYMIEICRRVLTDMTASGPFAGYAVEAVPVKASGRFDMLENGAVDLLCGPDSITVGRLAAFSASHPVFLSGITFVRKRELPRGNYCKSVVGLLSETTAESEGLEMLAHGDELGRFSKPLRLFITAANQPNPPAAAGASTSESTAEVSDAGVVPERLVGRLASTDTAPAAEEEGGTASFTTTECPDGYEVEAVKFYDSHDEGISAFCKGEVLYYLGDFDIIERKLALHRPCEYLTRRETMTRESYGVYFRRTSTMSARSLRDGALFAEFSNVLLRQMKAQRILDYEFSREFDNAKPSEDLESFFENFRYATH